jgi:hypothetical protein
MPQSEEAKALFIGDRLRVLREEKKFSQGEIEKRTGLLRSYISRVENGHTVHTATSKVSQCLDDLTPFRVGSYVQRTGHFGASSGRLGIQIVQRYQTFSFRWYINSGFSRLFR